MKKLLITGSLYLITLLVSAQEQTHYEPNASVESYVSDNDGLYASVNQSNVLESPLSYLNYSGNKLISPSSLAHIEVANATYSDDGSFDLGVALTGGYMAMIGDKTHHFGYLGADLCISPSGYTYSGNTMHQFLVGGGVYIGNVGGSTAVIPTLSLCYSMGSSILADWKMSVSPNHINPSIGLNVINLLRVNAGYSFNLKKQNDVELKGVTIGISLSIGTSKYYSALSN